jgi:hypothetical protein
MGAARDPDVSRAATPALACSGHDDHRGAARRVNED